MRSILRTFLTALMALWISPLFAADPVSTSLAPENAAAMRPGKSLNQVWKSSNHDWSSGWSWSEKGLDAQFGGKSGFLSGLLSADFRSLEAPYVSRAAMVAAKAVGCKGSAVLKITILRHPMGLWELEGVIDSNGTVVGCFRTTVVEPRGSGAYDGKMSRSLAQDTLTKALIVDLYNERTYLLDSSKYKTADGRNYILKSFPAENDSPTLTEIQKRLDEKNGFRNYRFGMTGQEFLATAKANKEEFAEGPSDVLGATAGLDPRSSSNHWILTSGTPSEIGGIKVDVKYEFYKKKLARVIVSPVGGISRGKGIRVIYDVLAKSYGPGFMKEVVVDGYQRNSSPSGPIEASKVDFTSGMRRGGVFVRPESIAAQMSGKPEVGIELLKTIELRAGNIWTGAIWFSDKVEILLTTLDDLFVDPVSLRSEESKLGGSGVIEFIGKPALSEQAAETKEKTISGI